MGKHRIAIFASGTGSNYEAIMETKDLPCEVVLLVSDHPKAPVIEKAAKYKTPTFVFNANTYENREAYEKEIVAQLKKAKVEWIFFAGYMRLIGPTLLDVYEGKIVNIHPSLLPQFPGLDAIGQALRAGVEKTGVTIHYVDAGMDTGPVITQEVVSIAENDTLETLTKKIQRVEHRLYPRTIRKLLTKNFERSHSIE